MDTAPEVGLQRLSPHTMKHHWDVVLSIRAFKLGVAMATAL